MQRLRRPLHIHTPLVSANTAIMWCMECIWISYRMPLLDRARVCMGGEFFFAYRVCGFCFFLGWLHGRAVSGSGRPCIHASIAVPRGGVWSASYPWSPDLACAALGAGSHVSRPHRQPFPLHYRRTTSSSSAPHPTLPCPGLTYCFAPAPCPSSSVCS